MITVSGAYIIQHPEDKAVYAGGLINGDLSWGTLSNAIIRGSSEVDFMIEKYGGVKVNLKDQLRSRKGW